MEFMQVKTDYLYFKNKWLWKKKIKSNSQEDELGFCLLNQNTRKKVLNHVLKIENHLRVFQPMNAENSPFLF